MDPQAANPALGGGQAEAGLQKFYRELVSLLHVLLDSFQ